MAKMRVHELAKELGKESKELLSFLSTKNIEVKSHASSLTEDQVELVKKAFLKPASGQAGKVETSAQRKAETGKAEAAQEKAAPVKTEAVSKQEEASAATPVPKKKPNIIQVFNPQNSQVKHAGQRQRTPGQRPMQGQPGQRPVQGQSGQRPMQGQPGQRPVQGQSGQRPVQGQQVQRPMQGQSSQRPMQSQPVQGQSGQRPMQSQPVQGQSGQRSVQGQPIQRPVQGQSGQRPMQSQPAQRPVQGQPMQGQPVQRPVQGQQVQRPMQGQPTQHPAQGQSGQRPMQGQSAQRPAQGQSGQRPVQGQSGQRPAQGQRPMQSQQGGRPYQGQSGSRTGQNQSGQRYSQGQQGSRTQNGQGTRTGQGQRPAQGGYQNNRGGQTGQRDNRGGNRPAYQGQGGKPQGYGGMPPIPKPPQDTKQPGRNDRDRKDRQRGSYQDNNRQNQRNQGKGNKNRIPAPPLKQAVQEPKEETIRQIILPEVVTIKELAEKMKVQPSAVVKKLFLQGKIVTVNQEVDYDTAEEIALEFNCIAEPEVKVDVIEELLKEDEEDTSVMVSRPPVVCVMGHVDHGKTSLLDAIRNTHVIDKEAGGITQHIGAYVVSIDGQKITFLDTPGHEAFTAMRMRGANSTDIAILVVAADDGVMPQTVEAINHAKAAGIEIIVAINKIDKPSANIERVKQELTEYELIPEDWGGSTVFVPVSAHTHEGIDNLLEMILLTAEVGELKANPKRRARGLVIEAELDKGKGPVATVLVQKGTLHVGDPIAAGSSYGKVRAMMDDKGRRVKEAGPSTPVEILGLSDVPMAGDIFVSPESDKEARNFAETFISQGRVKLLEETKAKMSLDDLFSQIKAGNVKELGIVVKADVQGSVEAVKQSLTKLSNEEVVVKIIHGGVGSINESDVILASASNAIIIGFNVRPDATAKATAEREGVDMRLYRVIYDAIADVEAAMKGMLDPIFEEKVMGHAEVRQTFKASGIGTIAGAYVLDGIFERNYKVRLSREGEVLFDGALASLKRFKDDVKEVKSGFECGLVFENFNDVKEGDQVEAYTMVEVPR